MFLPCSIYKTELWNSSMCSKRHGPPSSVTAIFLDFMCNLLTYFTLTFHSASHYLLKRAAHSYRFFRHPLLFLLPFTWTSPSSFWNPFYLTKMKVSLSQINPLWIAEWQMREIIKIINNYPFFPLWGFWKIWKQ